jgi:endoglucanase
MSRLPRDYRRLETTFYIFFSFLLLSAAVASADGVSTNRRLGHGINMGDMLEAPSEGEWGFMLEEKYFPLIASRGFDSVRIPIRWSAAGRSNPRPPYAIAEAFFKRVDRAIDAALASRLAVVINCHHYTELFSDLAGQRDRFLAIWGQIASRYRRYPPELVFEILNEPNGALDSRKWNTLLKETLAVIRKTNPDRAVVIDTADWGGVGSIGSLELPDDGNLILTVHYYNPFPFTHQEADWVEGSMAWKGTRWEGTPLERSEVKRDMNEVRRFASKMKIPVFVGEFGAYEKADMTSRVKWTAYCASVFEELGFSWAYWEFCAGFGVYDPAKKDWRPELLGALTANRRTP